MVCSSLGAAMFGGKSVGHRDNVAIILPPQNRADPSPSTRLKQSTYLKRCTGAVNSAMARVLDEPQTSEYVRAALFLRHHVVAVGLLAILEHRVTDGT
jgi:hypothetical protein